MSTSKSSPDSDMADGSLEIITFSPDDPENPIHWSRNFKRVSVAMTCFTVFVAVLGSSVYAPAELQIRKKYGTSPDVTSLGLTLFVLGFAFGPLIWGKILASQIRPDSFLFSMLTGPMAEMYGRKLPYLVAWPLFIATLAPSAWADNVVVIILFRIFSGTAAAAPLNNGPAVMADLYGRVDLEGQAVASTYIAFSAFCGPTLAPVAGFFLSTRFPAELWVLRVHFLLAIATFPVVLLLPETHGPTILARRAKTLRKSGRPNAWAAHELARKTSGQLLRANLIRPSLMFIKEPIVIGASVWTALAYGILYFLFESYPVIFVEQHNIPERFAGLPFIPIIIGMMLGVIPYLPLVRFFQKLRLPEWMGDANDYNSPESMLKLAFLACVCLPISSFWLAWSSGPETHWAAPLLSGIPFGFALLTIFFTFLTYLSHTYGLYTASAMAANTLARSVAGAIFPVVAHRILDQLGTKWGMSLFGFLSLGLIPIPIIFLRNGKRLRQISPYAREARALMENMESKRNAEPAVENGVQEKIVGGNTSERASPDDLSENRTPPDETHAQDLKVHEGCRSFDTVTQFGIDIRE